MLEKTFKICFILCVTAGYFKVNAFCETNSTKLTSVITNIILDYYSNTTNSNFDQDTIKIIVKDILPLIRALEKIEEDVRPYEDLKKENILSSLTSQWKTVISNYNPASDEHPYYLNDNQANTLQILQELHLHIIEAADNNLISLLNLKYEDIFSYFELTSKQQYFYRLLLSLLDFELMCYKNLRYIDELAKESGVGLTKGQSEVDQILKELYDDTLKLFIDIIKNSGRKFHRHDLMKKHVRGETFELLQYVFGSTLYKNSEIYGVNSQSEICTVQQNQPISPSCIENNNCLAYRPQCHTLIQCEQSLFSYDVCPQLVDGYKQFRYFKINPDFEYPDSQNECRNQFIQFYTENNNDVICKCTCEESDPNYYDGYFDLQDVLSDTESNKIVVGVQIVKTVNTFHIEIEQAKLLPYGFVSEKSREWKRKDPKSISNILTGKFHRVSYIQKSTIGFYNAEIEEKNRIITGVRFALEPVKRKDVLKIEFQTSEFNFEIGQIIPFSCKWFEYSLANKDTFSINIDDLEAPIYTNTLHITSDKPRQLAHFTPSGLATVDSGVTTGPYLDIQPVSPCQAAPLVGINAEYMASEGSMGYYQLSTTAYDFSKHLTD